MTGTNAAAWIWAPFVLTFIAFVIGVLPMLASLHSSLSTPYAAELVGNVSVHEDDPGWDCHTMGNRICGVTR